MQFAEYLPYLWAMLFLATLAVGWVLTLLSLPGNWLIVAAAAVYAFFLADEGRLGMRWETVAALVILAIFGELLELLASALGAARGGGSKRAAILAVLFSVPGAMFGAFAGSGIPVIGTLVGVILFAGFGALAGAMLGEMWKGRDWKTSVQVGHSAFWGRILGSLAKVTVGSIMVAVGATSVFIE